MRRLAAAAVLFVSLLALPLFAADGYRFQIKVTDGRTALLANPALAELHMTEAEIERAADDRVILLDHAEGPRWKWLTLSWLYDGAPPQYGLNERGTTKSAAAADVTITPLDYKRFRLRCERDRCRVTTTSGDGREAVTELRRGETADLRFQSDIAVAFDAEH